MATTTNYSWTTPDDTDLVKDGAAAIRTLGSSADTTVKNLNPGTTAGDIDYYTSSTAKARIALGTANQVLQVNSGATAPEWGVDPVADVITTAGDLLYGTAADTVTRLGIGTAGQVLTVNSGATAPEWAAPAGGKVLQVVSASTTTSTTIATSTYTDTTITATITPTLATSKILVIISAHSQTNKTASGAIILGKARVLRGATSIFESLRYTFLEGATVNTLELGYQGGITYLDSPATTSATTYKMQAGIVTGAEIVFQNGGTNQSTITLLEIGV